MRIGIYGGTFDPVHVGHLVLAEQCREQCRLDEVWFVPAGRPPHKTDAAITPARQRLEMLELALAGHDRFRIHRFEVERSGPSFTVETLQHVHEETPGCDWFLLLGADSVRDFPTWREPDRIAELATIVAVNRGDRPPCDPREMVRLFGEDRFVVAQMPGLDIASSDLRRRVHEGRSIRYLVPRGVEVYIQQHKLYRSGN
jgi:nicotinate-nucleotide adenylyltransferase